HLAQGALDGVVNLGGQVEYDAIVGPPMLVGTDVSLALVAEHQPTGTEQRIAPGVAIRKHTPVDQRDRERAMLLVLPPAAGCAATLTILEGEPAHLLERSVLSRRFGRHQHHCLRRHASPGSFSHALSPSHCYSVPKRTRGQGQV